MTHFLEYPKTTFLNKEITNLAVGLKLNALIKDGTLNLLNYVVKEADKIETVAFNYYGDPAYAYLILLANDILDPYWEWPQTTYMFEQFLIKKYGSIPTAKATTIHCEHKTKNITVSADSLVVSNGVSSSNYDSIDAYSYWDKINDNRRNIKLVDRVYIPLIDAQLKNLMDE